MRQQKLAQNTGSFEWAMLVTSKTSNCGWYQDTSYCIRLSLVQSLHSINLAINLRCVAFNDCDLNVWAVEVKFHCSNHFNRGKTQHSIISAGYSISKWIQESVQSVHGKFGRLLQILRAWLFMCKMLHYYGLLKWGLMGRGAIELRSNFSCGDSIPQKWYLHGKHFEQLILKRGG